LYDALGDMVDSEKATELVKTGAIEVAPLAFLRGRSLNHSFILLDEAQNTTIEQMKMFLTRMGNGSKMVITGDSSQVDLELPEFKRNGLDDAIYLLEGVRGVSFTFFDSTDVVRHPLVQRIVCAYEEREERSRNYRS
jgi:phosphate starvation-inducible PhoH-like protein